MGKVLEVLAVPNVPNEGLNQIHYFCSAIENQSWMKALKFQTCNFKQLLKKWLI